MSTLGPDDLPSIARQAFLLRLTDVLRGAGSTHEILQQVSTLVGESFAVDRVGYGHVDEALDQIDYDVCWTARPSVPPLLGSFPASAFGPQVIARLRAGETIVIGNVRTHPLTSEDATIRTSHEVDTRAILVVPLFKAGRLRTIVYLNQGPERAWTPQDVDLMQEVAERTRELIERGRAEQALRESEAKWRGLFERMGEGFFVGEALRDDGGRMVDFRFVDVNPAFQRLTGIAPGQAIGRPVSEVIPGFPQHVIDTYARVVDSGEPTEFEVQVAALDDRWYEARCRAVGHDQFSVLFLEITERKLGEAALREADARKDEFLATLAHELRNPLAPLRNGLAILRHADAGSAAGQRARELMERQLVHLVRLVDDLLDVSRVSRGKIALRKQRVPLRAVVELALETSQPAIAAAAHELHIALPEAAVLLDVDPTRVAQVLSNLLTNAAKYTPAGGRITLEAQRLAPDRVAIAVEDNGIGIPPRMLDQVFELFAQVGGALERSQGGLGIGLSLARRLVELHGGSLRASSDGEGRGSRFVAELPALPEGEAPADAPVRPITTNGGRGKRVLVVDDNVDAAETLAMLLDLDGHAVHVVHDGESALAAAELHRPEVVFLDIGLPGMNGYEVARRLRGRPALDATVLVALTGWGAARDQERAREAGMDTHLTKPVGTEDLARALQAVRGGATIPRG